MSLNGDKYNIKVEHKLTHWMMKEERIFSRHYTSSHGKDTFEFTDDARNKNVKLIIPKNKQYISWTILSQHALTKWNTITQIFKDFIWEILKILFFLNVD